MPIPSIPASLPDRLRSVEHELKLRPTLDPHPITDRLFTELVRLCTAAVPDDGDSLMSNPDFAGTIAALRTMAAEGEGRLEAAWSRRIAAAPAPVAELKRFPYYENYVRLTRMEAGALAASGLRPGARILFVGAGPLPVSMLMLHRDFGYAVAGLDVSADAATAADRLTLSLDQPEVRTVTADALTYDGYGQFDAVILAALVGHDAESKQAVIDRIRGQLAPGALLAVRSADGLRRILYPPVGLAMLNGFEPCLAVRPLDDVINSVIIVRQPVDRTGLRTSSHTLTEITT